MPRSGISFAQPRIKEEPSGGSLLGLGDRRLALTYTYDKNGNRQTGLFTTTLAGSPSAMATLLVNVPACEALMLKKFAFPVVATTSRALCVLLALAVTSTADGRAGTKDYLGYRFWCGEVGGVQLCLNPLSNNCSLFVAPGQGLPREPGDRVVVIEGENAHLVKGPQNLMGCVRILTEEQALEYLRFFSSFHTVHLFSDKTLEVYGAARSKACYSVCLPPERWRALGLVEPVVKRVDDGFEVTRVVIREVPGPYMVTLLRLVQRVGKDGQVDELRSEHIEATPEDRLRLGFPRYL